MFEDRPIRDGFLALVTLTLIGVLAYYVAPHKKATFQVIATADTTSVRNDSGPTVYVNQDGPRRLRKAGFSYYHISQIMYLRSCGYAFRTDADLLTLRYADTALVTRLSPRLDFTTADSAMADVADLASVFQYRGSRHSYADWGRQTGSDRRAYSPRIPFFAADSATLAEAGMTPDAWDSLAAYQRDCVIRGSMTLDSLASISAADLANVLRQHSTPRKPRNAASSTTVGMVDNNAETPHKQVDVNTATREELLEINGIGEKTADAIIDLRRRLGGFVDVRQLKEVWTLSTPERYDAVSPFLTVTSAAVHPINVNAANDTRLRRHPYFPSLLANRIAQMRLQKGGKKLDRADVERCAEGIEVSEFFWEYVSY